VAHATVTDDDSGDNGRFDCRLHGPPAAAAKFTLRRLYATEFVIATARPLADIAAEPEPEVDGGGPDAPGRRVVGHFALVCRDHGDPAMTSLIQVRSDHGCPKR